METGSIPWFSETEVKDAQGNHVRTDATATHPPEELNQEEALFSPSGIFGTRESVSRSGHHGVFSEDR